MATPPRACNAVVGTGSSCTALGTHLMEQFWSSVSNTRMDRYGGDLDGRMRFSFEILQRVAEVVSPDFLVCFRISGDPASDLLGLSEDDLTMIARKLDAFGRVDVFSVSGGSGVNIVTHAAAVPNDTFPVSVYNYVGRRMKTALSAPVIVAGRISTPADAETGPFKRRLRPCRHDACADRRSRSPAPRRCRRGLAHPPLHRH